MSNKEKSIPNIEFSGKKTGGYRLSEKFLSCGKWKGYKKLLVSYWSTTGVDKIHTQDEYKNALDGDIDLDKKIIKLGELNELAHEGLILPINTSSSVGKGALGLLKNAKSEDFSEENCKVAWDRLVSKYAPHTALSLQLKNKFHNSKVESIDKNPCERISHLEGL